jgi:hypothetical protein
MMRSASTSIRPKRVVSISILELHFFATAVSGRFPATSLPRLTDIPSAFSATDEGKRVERLLLV